MERLKLWPVLALLYGCSSPPGAPPPDSQTRLLRPGIYEHVTWKNTWWKLAAGQPPPNDRTFHEFMDTQEVGDWFTLSMNTKTRFVLQQRKESIRIYRLLDVGYLEFARIPLPLSAGMTWKSYRREFNDKIRVLEETATCRREPVQGNNDTFDTLRVDFSEDGVRTSMWFDRAEGLVRWDGIEEAPVKRYCIPFMTHFLNTEAATYASYGRVSDDLKFAPAMCAPPPEARPQMSASSDEGTHGKKMYYLYARYKQPYWHSKNQDQPDGQVVVKESWYPGSPLKKGPLFMMMKNEGDWIYATATPDGRSLTASGKLAACMECHESDRTRDRMFGLTPYAAAK